MVSSITCFCESIFIESEEPCDFEAKHRTVIGFGKAVFIEDEAEKIKALDLIVAHFTEKKFEYPKTNLDRTAVIRIDIVSVKGKKHGFQENNNRHVNLEDQRHENPPPLLKKAMGMHVNVTEPV